MSDLIQQELIARMEAAIVAVKKDLATVRTGRAKPGLVESVKVEAYGTLMELKEVASISAPDTNMLVINPWDKSLVNAVSNGIRKAELNLNPVVDGELVKIMIPALTQERREELVKLTHQKLEAGKVMIRQIRSEIKDKIEDQEDTANVSEDDIKRWLENMQKSVDDYMGRIDTLGKEKENELMTL